MDAPSEYARSRGDEAIEDLRTLLAQPSISTTDSGVAACLEIVAELCGRYGFETIERVETDGQPSLLARAKSDRPDALEILIYGHYDVQPADPDEWTSPPFEPTIRQGPDGEDRIYARGAGDNKGQWFAHLVAVDAFRQTTGLPVDVTLILDGEEESGSPHIDQVVESLADDIDPTLVYVADGPIDVSGRPHVILGVRGILYVQLDARGPNRDLHSGGFGGAAPNPAWALVELLATMKDDTGRVTIDGFYDDVRPITDSDRRILEAVPFDDAAMRADLDVPRLARGPGDSTMENLIYYPTLNICGFASGYGGEGMMTIIPSRASAKIDMRLAADQDPDEVYETFVAYAQGMITDEVDLEISRLGSMTPQRTPVDHPIREPIVAGVAAAWGTEPLVKPALGGSLPTGVLGKAFDAPCVIVPYANPDENNHSPDENLAVWCFENGVQTTIEVLARLGTFEG